MDPNVQRRIEDLLHTVQYEQVKGRLAAWVKDGGVDLLEGLWIIATYQYPDLDFEKLKKKAFLTIVVFDGFKLFH